MVAAATGHAVGGAAAPRPTESADYGERTIADRTTVTGAGRRGNATVRAMTTLRLPVSVSASRARRRPWTANRTLRRLSSDPQALLALGLVTTVAAIAVTGSDRDVSRLIAISIQFLAAQAIAAVA